MSTREHILVVDDDAAGRYLKAHVLTKAGYQVAEAATGKEARDRLQAGGFALVLLDVKLPDASGIELCREIKRLNPDLAVLQTSAAFTSRESRVAGLAGGADGYLIEPLDPEELLATVEALLRRYRTLMRQQDTLEQTIVEHGQRIAEIGAKLREEIGQREDAEEQLRHAQKLDVLGQLTGGIAHDFNNVLTIIMGNLESMRRHLERRALDPAVLKGFTDSAFYGTQRAIGITRQLLAFSRRQTLAPKVLDVNPFIQGLTQLLKQVLGEKVEIVTELTPEPWPVFADPLQFETAILNLAVNARDAMLFGGKVVIETKNVPGKDGDFVSVFITDTGAGMSPEVLKMAVEPFFTTKDVGHGTGLGLAQVHGFMNQSGGRVEIDSAVGRGTSVVMSFPRFTGERPVEPEVKATVARAVPTFIDATILVVEDDEPVRAHTTSILGEMGYTVLEAATGKEALDALQKHPEVRLLFTDIGLAGGLSGAQVGRAAIRLHPALKVLYTTGYANERLTREGLTDRDSILRKPFTYDELSQRLTMLLGEYDRLGSILLVEDEPLIRMDIVASLEEMGLKVVEAGSVAEATAQLAGNGNGRGSDVAAMIIDVGLPDGRGDEFVKKMRPQHPNLPIVVTSGYGEAALKGKFAGDDHIALLGKPCYPDDMVGALRTLGFFEGPQVPH